MFHALFGVKTLSGMLLGPVFDESGDGARYGIAGAKTVAALLAELRDGACHLEHEPFARVLQVLSVF